MTATIGNDCGCGGTTATGSSTVSANAAPTSAGERTRFYPRQLVSAADLTQDQLYFREKMRRHNRMLHGWGIVCGAEVRASKKAGSVDVNTGYVLGPFGDEIVIDDVVTVDLSAQNADGDALNGCVPPDPWCADVRVARPAGQTLYLAIAYAEFACRPVQTATSTCGCGCDETSCEYSRVRDSYRIRVLDSLPETYQPRMSPPLPDIMITCRSSRTESRLAEMLDRPAAGPEPPACDCPQCTPCPTSPWVILADITVNGNDISIDCGAHRRYVASARDFYYMCHHADQPKTGLGELFSKSALDRLRTHDLDIAGAVLNAPAKDLNVPMAANSALRKHLADMTVTDIAVQPKAAFIANATAGVAAESRVAVAETAGKVWENANSARRLASGL